MPNVYVVNYHNYEDGDVDVIGVYRTLEEATVEIHENALKKCDPYGSSNDTFEAHQQLDHLGDNDALFIEVMSIEGPEDGDAWSGDVGEYRVKRVHLAD